MAYATPLKRLVWFNLHKRSNLVGGADPDPDVVHFHKKVFTQRGSRDLYYSYPHDEIPDAPFVYCLQVPQRTIKDYDFLDINSGVDLFSTNEIPENVLQRVKDKRAYFCINIVFEAFVNDRILNMIHAYFQYHKVPITQIIYITNCANGTEIVNQYKKSRGYKDSIVHIYYPACFEDYSKAYDKNTIFTPNSKKLRKTFLCFNRNYHNHRLFFHSQLVKNDLLKHFYFSMPVEREGMSYEEAIVEDYRAEKIRKQLGINSDLITKSKNTLPLVIDDYDIDLGNKPSGNESSFYRSSLISVVSETYFFNKEIHITEKTYKPIALGHPFILLAPKGTLLELRKQGFITFKGIWDESYDIIEDDTKRMQHIVKLLEGISRWSPDRKIKTLDFLKPILEHNQSLLKDRIDKGLHRYVDFKNLR